MDRRKSPTSSSSKAQTHSGSTQAARARQDSTADSLEQVQDFQWTASKAIAKHSESEDWTALKSEDSSLFNTPTWTTISQDLQQYRPLRSTSDSPCDWEVVPFGLPQDPEQQSLCFFMSKFAMDDRKEEIWGGSLEALSAVYPTTGPNSALSIATAASSMSSMAWNPEYAHFKPMALGKYVHSIQLITQAVQDPKESQSDATLMAVLMLCFYEVRLSGG